MENFLIVKDILTILPFFIWCIISVVSLPTYTSLEWPAPITCALFSIVVCCIAIRDMWQTTYQLRSNSYRMIGIDTNIESMQSKRCKFVGAFLILAISICWSIICLSVHFSIIVPQRSLLNCTGCSSCVTDPGCATWAADIMSEYPVSNICPPAQSKHATLSGKWPFSCIADAAWLLTTSGFVVLWIMILIFRQNKSS